MRVAIPILAARFATDAEISAIDRGPDRRPRSTRNTEESA
jgi:hypothetical protein